MPYRIFIIAFLSTHAFACQHETEKKQEVSDDFFVIENDTTPIPSFETIKSEIDALNDQVFANKNINYEAKFRLQMSLSQLKTHISKIKYIESPLVPRKDQSAKTKNSIDQAMISAKFKVNKDWQEIKKTITDQLK